MPHTSYALFKAIRAHRVDSPSALRHAETGRPNACNLCHVDRSLAWTAQYLERWFGQARLPSSEPAQASAMLTAAIAGNAAERAVAAYALGRPEALKAGRPGFGSAALALLLDDPYSAVRLVAYRAAELAKSPGLNQASIDALRARRDESPITIAE
jgi:hypothetical protein